MTIRDLFNGASCGTTVLVKVVRYDDGACTAWITITRPDGKLEATGSGDTPSDAVDSALAVAFNLMTRIPQC